MERDGLGVFEVLVLVLAGAALLVVGVVWAGAALALLLSGAPQGVTFSAAADATVLSRRTWPHRPLPGRRRTPRRCRGRRSTG